MKQILLVLGVFALCSLPLSVKATEEVALEVPSQVADDNRALLTVQKQPAKENKQQANRNWFCIVIQVNGKIKDSANSDNN
jgi:glycine cleavage system H lipoate-binding protein